MDDDYELVSKEILNNLREENKNLKKKLEEKSCEKIEFDSTKLIDKVVLAIDEKSKKETLEIKKNLDEIKEINKNTLDNLIQQTSNLDKRLEDMISTINDLVKSLLEIITKNKEEHISENELKLDEKEKISIKTLSEKIDYFESLSKQNLAFNSQIQIKLDEINLFMKNLRILLSYVKPNNLKIEK